MGSDYSTRLSKIRRELMDMETGFTGVMRGHEAAINNLDNIDFLFGLNLEELESLQKAWETKIPLTEPILVCLSSRDIARCEYCGEAKYLFNGFQFKAEKECAFKNGWDLKLRLQVPSGRLWVGNNFTKWFPLDPKVKDEIIGLQEKMWIKKIAQSHEKHGMLHFFVSNTSPSVYRDQDNRLFFASGYADEKVGEINPIFGKNIGCVWTDLWWVCIVDGDHAEKRGMQLRENDMEIMVEPGTYQLDYNGLHKGFLFEKEALTKEDAFAMLKKI